MGRLRRLFYGQRTKKDKWGFIEALMDFVEGQPRYGIALDGSDLGGILSSLLVGAVVSALTCVIGTGSAMIQQKLGGTLSSVADFVLMLPSAVPSVVVGLLVLMAYHRPPLDISGTPIIVVLAQQLLALPFSYRIMSAAVGKLPASLSEAGAGLGASPLRRLWRITLPLLVPSIRTCVVLGFALSIGELGATMMVYPPGFTTAPVVIIQYVQRGYYYQGSALALLLLISTLV